MGSGLAYPAHEYRVVNDERGRKHFSATIKHMKKLIYLGIAVGGILGGWIGTMLDKGNALGAWSLLGSTLGSLLGIWAGYKIGQNME